MDNFQWVKVNKTHFIISQVLGRNNSLFFLVIWEKQRVMTCVQSRDVLVSLSLFPSHSLPCFSSLSFPIIVQTLSNPPKHKVKDDQDDFMYL